jgi:myo-inositol-1(or 4)-monophosphatase
MARLTPERAGDIISELAPAVDACRAMLLDRYHSRTWLKDTSDGRREIVSELDLAVQDHLITAIQAIEPSASVFSEEGANDPTALDEDLCFVIDPIDGTDLMLAGKSGYAISIAIVSAHQILAGLLDFPARGQRFICALGHGAALNDQRIQVQGAQTVASARVAVSSTQLAEPTLQRLWPKLGVAALVPTPGFTAKLASILLGDCDAAVYLPIHPRPTFIWDYAAAALLLQESGGRLTTLDGHAFVDALPIEQREGWLAASDILHTPMQTAVTDALTMIHGVDAR